MAKPARPDAVFSALSTLISQSFLFRGLPFDTLQVLCEATPLVTEKLYSNRPIYTAFRPDDWLANLYVVVDGGPVIMRSTPLDRIIAITYPGGSFGMRCLPLGCGRMVRAFPSLVEAYKTTDVTKVPFPVVEALYQENETFRARYDTLFELREKFQYHLLNCSAYPPQAVAALLRALIYQERELGHQPQDNGRYRFDLSIDLIARACQLNHRTVEQVLKGMTQAKILQPAKGADSHGDWVEVIDPEGLKEVYGATRDKVAWWPLK